MSARFCGRHRAILIFWGSRHACEVIKYRIHHPHFYRYFHTPSLTCSGNTAEMLRLKISQSYRMTSGSVA